MNSTGLKPIAKPIDLSVLGTRRLSTFLHELFEPLDAEALIERGAIYLNKNRVIAETFLKERDCIRVHLSPRRFDTDWDWARRIVAEDKDFLIVNKPTGLPVHPTCDNEKENLLRQLEKFLQRELWICHRLDIGTEGLLVVGKSRSFRRWFAELLELRKVEKRYRARATKPVKPGKYEHYQASRATAPFIVTQERVSESDRYCSLTVLSCEPIGAQFELMIALHTGRHHQIRAQLAAVGAPLVGDISYGAPSRLPVKGDGESLLLQSAAIGFQDLDGRRHSFELASPWG